MWLAGALSNPSHSYSAWLEPSATLPQLQWPDEVLSNLSLSYNGWLALINPSHSYIAWLEPSATIPQLYSGWFKSSVSLPSATVAGCSPQQPFPQLQCWLEPSATLPTATVAG